jgi:hypothetical protein
MCYQSTIWAFLEGSATGGNLSYSWTWNFSDGSPNAWGQDIVHPSEWWEFTAGPANGIDMLFVNATQDGLPRQSIAIAIYITPDPMSVLTSVTITPVSSILALGTSATFSAFPSWAKGACPARATYRWSLSADMGSLNSSYGPSVTFTAGSKAGSVILTVNATLNGVTTSASIRITTVAASGSGTTSYLGFGTTDWGIVVVTTVVLALVTSFLLVRARKAPPRAGPFPPQPEP